ncbi:tRNA (adenosine(37)-N6)-threonylcarbamoyltransferase complex ATPase subunit type 1 TsaE [Chachezhania sediminis]|uniref:tRNA (adenosine(37)-N6)-threonylcarbamoyltransferase complex ATPase subunit type 1 TsaE n=1 Tax=Chachezhania sediminis TaxID=2599291 RepID=UPI00131D3942|nr:tRNA (adenosine(37)-N6)-threonylcarbamoyltransferase complex ATPase subunit type 1 TsaE [Chachezhania sediminis]
MSPSAADPSDRCAPSDPPGETRDLTLADETATATFAEGLAACLAPGDCLLLTGPIGAGKTHFTRALIRARLGSPSEDVPSPTFTLVQTYGPPEDEIWHADLYRLTDTSEVQELGLADAFETAVTVIEWPDRLGDLAPAAALALSLIPGRPISPEADDAPRHLRLSWRDPKWTTKLADLIPAQVQR